MFLKKIAQSHGIWAKILLLNLNLSGIWGGNPLLFTTIWNDQPVGKGCYKLAKPDPPVSLQRLTFRHRKWVPQTLRPLPLHSDHPSYDLTPEGVIEVFLFNVVSPPKQKKHKKCEKMQNEGTIVVKFRFF